MKHLILITALLSFAAGAQAKTRFTAKCVDSSKEYKLHVKYENINSRYEHLNDITTLKLTNSKKNLKIVRKENLDMVNIDGFVAVSFDGTENAKVSFANEDRTISIILMKCKINWGSGREKKFHDSLDYPVYDLGETSSRY